MVGGATPAAHSSDQHVDSDGVSSVNLPEMDSRFLLKAPEAPEGKQWYKGESLRETATDIDNGATVYLNPVTIGLCNAGFGDKKVKTFNSKNDGEITLYCGVQIVDMYILGKGMNLNGKARREGSRALGMTTWLSLPKPL